MWIGGVSWLLQGADREYWHWTDLNIGTVLSVYGREITLTNCDTFTRSHLASEGVELAPVETGPPDIYQVGYFFQNIFFSSNILFSWFLGGEGGDGAGGTVAASSDQGHL